MKKSYGGSSRLKKLSKSNGIYISIAVALIAVGVLGVSRLVATEEETPATPNIEDEMVEQIVTGEPDDRTTTTEETTSVTTVTTKAEEEAPELYVLPLSNTVQKPFSPTAPLFSETLQHWKLHLGTDFAGEEGQEVKALARGTVTEVKKDALWGDVIVIDHSIGVISQYCGVKAQVKEGEEVAVGDVIGSLSEIPCEAAQPLHLHLEMTVDGTPIDPVEAIGVEVRYADALTE